MTKSTNLFDSDSAMAIHGVNGRLQRRTTKPGNEGGALWLHQNWISEARKVDGYSPTSMMRAEIRFDDDCGNGHNSFAITGVIARGGRFNNDNSWEAFGCLHEDIAATFPELAHLIPWHLTSSDGPMHYIANALYHVGNRDCHGKLKGEVRATSPVLIFGDNPIQHKLDKRMKEFLQEALTHSPDGLAMGLEVLTVAHKDNGGSGYQYGPKYQFAGQPPLKWHECAFDTEGAALRFAAALQNCQPRIVDVPTSWGEGKARDLDAARRAANWPDATDAQLCAPRDELKAALEARAPALIAEFRAAMEGAGLVWSPADFPRDSEGAA